MEVKIYGQSKTMAMISTQKVDEILANYKQGTYNFDETKTKLLEVDNIELVDIDETNVDEVISQTRKE